MRGEPRVSPGLRLGFRKEYEGTHLRDHLEPGQDEAGNNVA